jgi:purine-nucleoside phosphorylase
LLGSCGGLYKEADSPDIIIPTYSYANESATRMYEPQAEGRHLANEALSNQLAQRLTPKHKVWQGPTVTCQAMMAETWEDIQRWAKDGYYGVEMEASTVFAVSSYFNTKAAAAVMVGDNLIQEKTTLDVNYEEGQALRRQVTQDMFDAAISELVSE